MNDITTIPNPSRALINKIADFTGANYHTEARILIARWAVNHAEPLTPFARTARAAYRFFKGLETIHNEMGYIVQELYEERERVTTRLLEALGCVNPVAASMFHKVL